MDPSKEEKIRNILQIDSLEELRIDKVETPFDSQMNFGLLKNLKSLRLGIFVITKDF